MKQDNISSLPKGWELKKLVEICEFENGDRGVNYPSKAHRTETGIPFINAGHLTSNGLDIDNMDYISRERFNLLGSGKIKNGDILFCLRGSLGKFAKVHEFSEGAIASSLVIVRPKLTISSEFLLLYFDSKICQKMIEDLSNGAAQPNLSAGSLKNFKIPLPPLPEQERIVDILDDAFAKIEKAKANAEQNLKNAKELFESYLQGVFENKGDDWMEKTLGEVCKISSKLIDPKISEYQNLIHIGAGNIESKKGTLIDLKTAKEENLISGKFLFDESMILYSKIRPYLIKVVNCEFQGLCSADIYPLMPIKEKMTKDFLYHLLLTKDFTDYAILGSQRAGMPKVNREHLFAYKFELPPIKEQKTIVQKLVGLSAETKKLVVIYEQKIKDLEELKKSLLKKAFSGELIEKKENKLKIT